MPVKTILRSAAVVVLSASAHASASDPDASFSSLSSSSSASSSCFDEREVASARSAASSSFRVKRARDDECGTQSDTKGARHHDLSSMSSAVSTGEAYYQQAIVLKKKKQYRPAFECLKRADQHGHVEAQVFLSRIYLEWDLTERYDPENETNAEKLTFYYIKRAAKGGHQEYQKELWESIMPDHGDLEGEIKWAKRNAESGDKDALARLTKITEDKEIERSLKVYAQYKLATLLHKGVCVEKDMDKAFDLLVFASKLGSEKAYDFIVRNTDSAEEVATKGHMELLSMLACENAGKDDRKSYTFARRAAIIAQKNASPLYDSYMIIQYQAMLRILLRNGCSYASLRGVVLHRFMALSSTPDYDTFVTHAKQKGLTRFNS